MLGTARTHVRAGVALAVLVAGLGFVGSSGAAAQSAADVRARDQLIANQENLLNTYRCRFGVDTHAVPGGCPNPKQVSPGVAPLNPSQHDIDVRDGLIQAQEALLNTYRCRFNIDTEIVPDGCPGQETGQGPSQPTSSADPSTSPVVADLYTDVEPEYYDEEREGPAGDVYDSINRLRGLGIFAGTDCGENKFCPDSPVDGATLAAWLVRVLEGSSSEAAGAVSRIVELGVAAPCGPQPDALCPGEKLSRAKVATFVSRGLGLPEAEPIGFWDVEEASSHFDHVNRLVASGINDGVIEGCTHVRFVPFNFCPGQTVSRGEAAETLSGVFDYLEASQIIKITEGSSPDNSIGLKVSFEEERRWNEVKATWTNPRNRRGGVSHYVLQWRPSWDDFNYRRYQVVEFDKRGRYEVEFPRSSSSNIYAVRVIVAYDNEDEDHLATEEVKVNNESHKLRDAIKEHIIDAHGEDQPWLVDTWRHLNGPILDIYPHRKNQVRRTSRSGFGQLNQTLASSLTLSRNVANNFEKSRRLASTVVHELGHVYTWTNGVTKNEAPVAIGYLYLGLLSDNHATSRCSSAEIYADLARAAFSGGVSPEAKSVDNLPGYWRGCRFDLDQKTSDRVFKDVRDLTQKVFLDQKTPRWFYDEYQKPDGSIDLDKLWGDISTLYAGERSLIIYGLRNEFGGYCSTEELYRLHIGEIDTLDTPWRDAGCR